LRRKLSLHAVTASRATRKGAFCVPLRKRGPATAFPSNSRSGDYVLRWTAPMTASRPLHLDAFQL